MKKNILTGCIAVILIVTILYSLFVVSNDSLLFSEDLILPVVSVLLCVVIFFLKIVPVKIKNAIVVILTLIVILRMGLLFIAGADLHFNAYSNEDAVKIYYKIEKDIIFSYDECRAYSYEVNALFKQDADTVIFKTGENFEEAKKSIAENYDFYTDPLKDNEPQPHFEFSGFNFRLQCIEKDYPKVMLFIGINEQSKEIAYVYFNDVDLDSVSDFKDILNFYCGWQYIELYENGKIFKNVVLL